MSAFEADKKKNGWGRKGKGQKQTGGQGTGCSALEAEIIKEKEKSSGLAGYMGSRVRGGKQTGRKRKNTNNN